MSTGQLRAIVKVEPRRDGWVVRLECGHSEVALAATAGGRGGEAATLKNELKKNRPAWWCKQCPAGLP